MHQFFSLGSPEATDQTIVYLCLFDRFNIMRVLIQSLIVLMPVLSWAQIELPEHFIDVALPAEFTKPVGIAFDHLGDGYVWEKDGIVWRLSIDGQKSDEPLVDIREEVTSWGDHGLVGFALDPNFAANGWFYLFYTVDRHHLMAFGTEAYDATKTISSQATIARITRFTADINSGFRATLPNSRKIIVGTGVADGLPVLMGSHATGSLVFGNDGTLIYSFGDGASYNEVDTGNAQNTYHVQALEDGIIQPSDNVGALKAMQIGTPNGKLSRIDPHTGEGLPSNPFYDASRPSSHQSRIWVLGLRNPYKFIKVENTGSHLSSEGRPGVFIVGDVGSAQWEEINVVTDAGAWFGWPVFEGHDYKWGGIWTSNVLNPEALNPEDCKDYFRFTDLWKNESPTGTYEFINPCNGLPIPSEILTFVHQRPALAYNADKWNPPARTVVPGFNEKGRAVGISVLESSTESQIIEGGSCIPGAINYFDGFPDDYKGKLFMGDYRGFISLISFNDRYEVVKVEPFQRYVEGLTDLTFHPQSGNLFYINILEGQVRRISYGGKLPPIIETDIDRIFGPSPLEVTFDSESSRAYDASTLAFHWDFGDGTEAEGPIVKHTFASEELRSFDVGLIVRDAEGLESREQYTISVNNTPPQVDINSIPEGSTYSIKAYNIFDLEADVIDDEHAVEDLTFAWRVDLYHDEHFHQGPIDPNKRTIAHLDPIGCELEEYWYRVNLTVTDPGGLSSTDFVEIYPYCGPDIAPDITLAGEAVDAGVQLEWSVGNDHLLNDFEIERTDEVIFQSIAEQLVEGGKTNYSYIDASPFLGKNIYRIKAFDDKGNYTYSGAISIDFYGDRGFHIFPNPARETLRLISHNPNHHIPEIKIVDVTGKVLITKKLAVTESIEEEIDILSLNTGVYFFSLSVGDKASWRKFLVK